MATANERRLATVLDATSPSSAAVVAPKLIALTGARSVLDVGCGTGAWLAAFAAAGVSDTLGLDTMGDDLATDRPPSGFQRVDLEAGFALERTFDLALCLEVAEHLAVASADRLVADLVRAAPAVAFSAAIPHQGGIDHVNEQWPSYWKSRFAAQGYEQHDVVRPLIWFDDQVAYWYRQNLFVYSDHAWVPQPVDGADDISTWVVHPVMYETSVARQLSHAGAGDLLRALPGAMARSIRARRAR